MNGSDNSSTGAIKSALRGMANILGFGSKEEKALEMVEKSPDPGRPNRLCVCISDIHLTDGTVGTQNLNKATWGAFYTTLRSRCIDYHIEELTFIIDGDVLDMIRSGKWAEKGIYPWERDRKREFEDVVKEITAHIIDVKHADFFEWLRNLPEKLKSDSPEVKTVKVVVLVGNHDKELLCVPEALAYFYEYGLGWKLEDIPEDYRRAIGRMYGDETQFLNMNTAPYPPFYYGDCGFRFFTTHGQWRDKENSRAVDKRDGLPGWSAKDGWQPEVWQRLNYSPFLLPCFGDSVAAGVLSTFIHKAKIRLKDQHCEDARLFSIIDELDLYRPTYGAVLRIIKETKTMRRQNRSQVAINIIEDTLYDCVVDWLSWDFTYVSSPTMRRMGLKIAKKTLHFMKSTGRGLQIKAIAVFMKIMNVLASWQAYRKSGVGYRTLRTLPAFLSAYRKYGFQVHGEGHTHHPLQEEPNFSRQHPSTYVNFGTWRDQIVLRKKLGYRRRAFLRAFFILDLLDYTVDPPGSRRSFDYYTEDIVHWSDETDSFNSDGKHQPHI